MSAKHVGLAFELRRAGVRDAANELCIEVAARIVHDFWKDSARVTVIPAKRRLGFIVLVDTDVAVEINPSVSGTETLRPIVYLERHDGVGAIGSDASEAHELVAEVVVSLLEKKDDDADEG